MGRLTFMLLQHHTRYVGFSYVYYYLTLHTFVRIVPQVHGASVIRCLLQLRYKNVPINYVLKAGSANRYKYQFLFYFRNKFFGILIPGNECLKFMKLAVFIV